MNLEEIQSICEQLAGTTTDIKWENHLCFNVGEKMYLVTSPDSVPISASFKVSDEDFETLCERPGFIPAPYLARYKWVHLDDISRLNKTEWSRYIVQSHQLIGSKLPAGLKKKIGLK